METAISLGKTPKETGVNIEDIISTIFESGHQNYISQETIVEAIRMVGRIIEANIAVDK